MIGSGCGEVLHSCLAETIQDLHRTGVAETGGGGRMTQQLPEGNPSEDKTQERTPLAHKGGVVSSFAEFLPSEYQSGFSSDWLMGLSPFEDRACVFCYSVRKGKWVSFGLKKAEERLLTCQRMG